VKTIEIINEIASRCNVSVAELLDRTKTRKVSLVRNICYLSLRKNKGLTYRELGNIFGRSTSTIITAVQCVNGYIDTNDKETVELYNRVKDIY